MLAATLTLAVGVTILPISATAASHDPAATTYIDVAPTTNNVYASDVSVSARSAAAIDVQTGRFLYEKNGDDKMLIASLTKIITCIVAIESGVDLDSETTVSNRAAGKEGSSIYLKVGEKQKIRDLLYAVMLRSGNDAATAVAEACGQGSEAKFVEMMNAKVQDLGLTGTHFANPHGLDAKDHYSTAHDMAVLTAYALRNPTFAQIVATQVKTIPYPGEDYARKLYNKNKMLTRYEGADGVKTGYTKAAGRCLVSSATVDGRQVAVVTLDAPGDWVDHQRLLDYGFEAYTNFPVAKEDEVVKTLPLEDGIEPQVDVKVGVEFTYPVRKNEQDKLRTEMKLDDHLQAPVVGGEKVGEMKIYYEDKLLGVVPLVAAKDVREKTYWERFKQFFSGMIRN
ncbi:D-alanyl-D-alanine carboxypeptidase [Tumebacillus sp. ITR2]|uniref:serine-type D-Ala-D-Ala carboxypeptidase n=2 Tax=Tumebacillus amylolyticus TaxID=2801339 RepID=A0ABS1JBJ3_9BACL|nr:D-alanyl-D-alanine carboxypeptidase [Tumebacillus amylolyticus]